MKISVLASIVLGFGLIIATLAMMANYGIIAKPLTPTELALAQLKDLELATVAEATTTLETESDVIDFGTLEEGVEVVHEYPMKNIGANPLRMTLKPSCGCIVVKDRKVEIAPGETATIPITIRTKDLYGIVDDKRVVIHTNDPAHPELSIKIKVVVTRPLEISPPKIPFNRLLAVDTVTKETKVYAQHDRPFEITGHRLSKPDIEKFFDVAYRPLEPTELPEGAKHGWLVSVTVKPGLPTGNFKQVVELETTMERALDTQIEIEGNVVNDIAVVAIGADYNAKYNLLTLGAIQHSQGAHAKLKMLVAGEYFDKIELGAPVCEPEFLRVTLGERKVINNGTASEIPIEVEVPADSPVTSLLGKGKDGVGRITIPTNHPSMKEVRILLHFAVEK